MSDTVNITIQVLDQVSATISTIGTQGPSGSQIMVDQTNDTRTGIWVLDDNDIYLDKTVAQDTTRTGPYVDFDLMEAQGYLVASDMQAAVEANSYDVLTLNDTAGGTTTLVCADGNLEVGGVALATTSDVAARQPLDSDLTAIAALTTTAYGRNLLTLANQAALQAAVGATGGGTWGSITGTLSSQTDLQTALNGKLGASVTKAELNSAVSDGDVVYVVHTVNGAASAPPLSLTGTWFTGGTSTTTKPQLLIEPTGSTSTGWNTAGTAIGVNSGSSFAGYLLDLQKNGVTKLSVDTNGTLLSAFGVTAAGSIGAGTGFYSNVGLGVQSSNTSVKLANNGALSSANTFAALVTNNSAMTQTSGSNGCLQITPTYNQTSGTAANTDLLINRTQTAVGSGAQLLIDAQVGSISKFRVDNNGGLTASGTVTIGSGTPIARVLSATATLDFGSIAANSFADLTITVTNAAVGDTVSLGVPNGSILSDLAFFGWVSATNTVTVRCLNDSATTARDPASGTFRATVTQF